MERCSLSQLSIEVGNSFLALRFRYPTLGEDRVKELQQSVLEGTYVLSPLKLRVYHKDQDQTGFFHTFSVSELPNFFFAISAEQEDELVLMALSRLLSLRVFHLGALFAFSPSS